MGPRAARLHTDNGVELKLGVAVEAIEGGAGGRVAGVRLANGSKVEADVVVVGIGVVPSTGWLEGSGLTLRDGVVCDARCRCAPGVVAAGDVARWYHGGLDEELRVEHWTNAIEQAEAAVRTLLEGDAAPPYEPVPYFWSDQYGTKIQYVGHAAPTDEVEVVEGDLDEDRFVAAYRRDGRVTAALLWNRAPRMPHWSAEVAAGFNAR
jgi:NADPH-dependent 2,4-dienoyl-CoA reductase/sulfur reductase-like enzyme